MAELKVGDVFTITRKSNYTAGYDYRVIGLKNIALLDTRREKGVQPADGPHLSGIAGKRVWTFQAVAEGTGEIGFAEYRVFDLTTFKPEPVISYDIKAADGNVAGEPNLTVAKGAAQDSADAAQCRILAWSPLGYTSQDILEQVLSGMDADFTAIACAKDAWLRDNIIFFANSKAAPAGMEPYPVAIHAVQEDGKWVLRSVTPLGDAYFLGSFKPFDTNLSDVRDVLYKIEKKLPKLEFKAYALSYQIVKGRNYIFIGNAQPGCVSAGTTSRPVVLTAYVSLKGEVEDIEVRELWHF